VVTFASPTAHDINQRAALCFRSAQLVKERASVHSFAFNDVHGVQHVAAVVSCQQTLDHFFLEDCIHASPPT
jgi:hypothetical protein